jgi:dTMP kinase
MQMKPPLQFYSEPLPGVDPEELHGKLIVIEGPDAVGRTTQISKLRQWLEQEGHAVLDTGMARGSLAGKGIKQAKDGNTLGPVTMTLYYTTDFADRLENEIIPALRAGFVVLTDRYIFSIMARAIARGEERRWIEQVTGFGLVPHAVYYLRADVKELVSRVVLGRGAFDFWESGMDLRFGNNMFDSFVRYQTRLIRALDGMAKKYDFVTIDASRPPDVIFDDLKRHIKPLEIKGIRDKPRIHAVSRVNGPNGARRATKR